MASFRNDPLLGVARGLLLFMMAALGLALAGMAVAVAGLALFYPTVLDKLGAHGLPPVSGFWAVIGLILLGGAMIAAVFRFLQLLRRIVVSVGEGDPFIPENAARLQYMAWLSLAVQGLAIPMGALGMWVGQFGDKADADLDVTVDANGLILALVLFILARVFRRGAEMREELEGTV